MTTLHGGGSRSTGRPSATATSARPRSRASDEARRPRSDHLSSRRLHAIIETQTAIADPDLDRAAMLGLVCRQTVSITGATGSAVEIADALEMVYEAVAGSLERYLGLRIGILGSLSGLAVRTGEILVCDDSETDARVDRVAARKVGARSMVVVPLLHAGKPVGVLKVVSDRPAAFDDDDVQALRLLAGLIASSLQRFTDQEERERLAALDAQRAALLEKLNGFSRLVSSSLDLRDIADHVVDHVGSVLPADVVALTLRDPDSGGFTVRAATGLAGLVGKPIRVGEGLAGTAIAAGRMVVREDVRREDYPEAVRALPPTDRTGIGAAVPILDDGVAIGAVTLARFAGPVFDRVEQEVLGLLAGQLSVSIGNSALHATVERLAATDPLTGLANRRTFDHESMVLQARRPPVRGAAILFDLDHFGQVNKRLGHAFGDEVLETFGAILHAGFRGTDLLARYGGEEFVAILPGATVNDAQRLAEDIRSRLHDVEFTAPSGEHLRITVSAGCATIADGPASIRAAVETADVALSMAKRAGRDQVVVAA